jgi:nicotinamidase-related amidase
MPGLRSLISGTRMCDIDGRVEPIADEPVFEKQAASAFFGTSLVSYLVGAGVDTVVVSGCVTSGCVRASVVDAISWGFRTIVPEECVGDRAAGPHTWSLFDMDSKYGDVEPLEDVIASLESTLTALP